MESYNNLRLLVLLLKYIISYIAHEQIEHYFVEFEIWLTWALMAILNWLHNIDFHQIRVRESNLRVDAPSIRLLLINL